MTRNLLAETPITHAFAQFEDGPNLEIHSEVLRPIFEALPARDQEWVTETVLQYDPRTPNIYPLSVALGVQESVAAGLRNLLHTEA